MTPTAFVTTILQDRGAADAVELPTEILFDHTYAVTFTEPCSDHLGLECMVDSAVPGSDPLMQARLLKWNRLPRMVGAGCFAVSSDDTIYYRLVVPVHALDVDQIKTIVDEFLTRVENLSTALLVDPVEAESLFPEETAAPNDDAAMMIGV